LRWQRRQWDTDCRPTPITCVQNRTGTAIRKSNSQRDRAAWLRAGHFRIARLAGIPRILHLYITHGVALFQDYGDPKPEAEIDLLLISNGKLVCGRSEILGI